MLMVTGITGHSGTYFLKELIDTKYDESIRCIVRETSDTTVLDNCELCIHKAVGDIDDAPFMEQCMDGVSTILHIAGIHKTPAVIMAASKRDVKRVIAVHTTGIYSKFKSASRDYMETEEEVRKIARRYNIGVTILRPTMIYGSLQDLNMSKFIKMIDTLRLFPVIEHGKGLIQPVHASDLGKAYYQVLKMPADSLRSEYILSGGEPITMAMAFKNISYYLGKETTFISVPMGLGVIVAAMLKGITLGKLDYVEKVRRMGEDRSFPYADAFEDFGYNPMSFEEGIKDEIAQYKIRVSRKGV